MNNERAKLEFKMLLTMLRCSHLTPLTRMLGRGTSIDGFSEKSSKTVETNRTTQT